MNSTHLNRPPRDPAERALRYVEAVLKRNPATQSPEILEIRDRFLGQKRAASAQAARVDLEELRESQLASIDSIRRDFWTSDLNAVRAKLTELDATPFPDVRLAVRRLSTVAEHRHLFPELVKAGSLVPNVFKAFREALVSPPVEAASWRQEATYRIRDVKPARAFAKAVRKTMPDVFELEADWMNMLLRMKPIKTVSESASSFSMSSSDFDYTWLIRILIFIAIAILRALAK